MIDDAARVRIIRAILGISATKLSEMVEVKPTTVTAWERGRSTPQRNKRLLLSRLCAEKGIAFLASGMPVPASDLLPPQELSATTEAQL